jgi:2-(1,2-epoxy-1,2-dihydrophenyl)acetyl-CoA isomerase
MNNTLLVDIRDHIATLTFNRPQVRNAMDYDLMIALKANTEAILDDDNVRAVIVRGARGAFMAGGDISQFHESIDSLPALITKEAREFHYSILALRRMAKPVLAVVEGPCAGAGISMMAACDLAIASEDAMFTLAYSNLGASPDGGSSYFLPRILGTRKALELAFLPDRFDAATALNLGLVNWVVPKGELEARVATVAKRLANGPTVAFAKTKALMNQSLDMSIEAQLEAEVQAFADCARTDDIREGVMAFVEKRKPSFTGK